MERQSHRVRNRWRKARAGAIRLERTTEAGGDPPRGKMSQDDPTPTYSPPSGPNAIDRVHDALPPAKVGHDHSWIACVSAFGSYREFTMRCVSAT